MEKELEDKLNEQQEEIERLKKQTRRQKWWNVWFAFSKQAKTKNKNYAIEVESGKKITYDPKRIKEKVEELNKNYKHWCFVVLSHDSVTKYKKLGETIDVRYLREKLSKLLG